MGIKDKSKLIIYRFKEKGLEVFLMKKNEAEWELPNGEGRPMAKSIALSNEDLIELDPVEDDGNGILEQAYAIEADWHEIPSLKAILKEDARFMKNTVKKMVPDVMEKGTYVAIKEAFKRVLPNQYEMLKELKEILNDRNLTKYL